MSRPVPPKAWSARLRREHEERQAAKAPVTADRDLSAAEVQEDVEHARLRAEALREPVTADVQRELAEAYAVAVGCANDCPDCAKTIAALIPTVERAEKRAAAAALRAIARAGLASSPGAHPVRVPVSYLFDRAAALDPAGAASGETT